MNETPHRADESVPLELAREIDRVCDAFGEALRTGHQPRIEDYLTRVAESGRSALLRELILAELEAHAATGGRANTDEYRARFPDDRPVVEAAFAQFEGAAGLTGASTAHGAGADGESVAAVSDAGRAPAAPSSPIPERIGRYAIRRRLGRGGFGEVYLAHDPELDRPVALKVPRADTFSSSAAVDRFVEEARLAARLDHPGIVRVYDILRDAGSVVVVQEYVEGRTLAQAAASEQFTTGQIARLLCDVADAVNFANMSGLVHRDLKPANILIDAQTRPHVADFGLAIHEATQRLRKGEVAGSPAYMAPEQVRGEAHRLDGRTDQWSLGVILYELLTRRRPFLGDSAAELFDEIDRRDPKPPRQINASVPAELERICLKCLSKRMADRYPTVADLADDLRRWQRSATSHVEALAPPVTPRADQKSTEAPALVSDEQKTAVVASATGARRPWRVVALAGAIGAAMAIGILIGLWARNPDPRVKVEPERASVGSGSNTRTTGATSTDEVTSTNDTESGSKQPVPSSALLHTIAPQPLDISPGSPMSVTALVGQPAVLPHVKSWTIDTRQHRGEVAAVAFSPLGDRLATGGSDGAVRIWNTDSGHLIKVLLVHEREVGKLAWSSMGLLASSSDDGTVRVWEPEAGHLLRTFDRGAYSTATPIAWSPDGRQIVCDLRTPAVWDVESGSRLLELEWVTVNHFAEDLDWSSDGELLVGAAHRDVVVWTARAGQIVFHVAMSPNDHCHNVAWSPDGMRLALRTNEKVTIHERPEWKILQTLTVSAPTRYSNTSGMEWSFDGNSLAVTDSKNVRIWDVDSGRMLRSGRPLPAGAPRSVSWSSRNILADANAQGIRIWNPETWDLPNENQSLAVIDQVAWSPTAERLLLESRTGGVWLWDAAEGEVLTSFENSSNGLLTRPVWSPNGQFFAVKDRLSGLKLFDAKSQECVWEFHVPGLSQIKWSANSMRLAVTGQLTLRVYEIKNRTLLREYQPGGASTVVWAPDSVVLARTFNGRTIEFWDTDSGEVIGQIEAPGVHRMEWIPGDTLASTDEKGIVTLWDAKSYQATRRFTLNSGYSDRMIWLPNEVLAFGNRFGRQVEFWNATSGERIRNIRGPLLESISRDSRTITASDSGAVRFWDSGTGVQTGALVQFGRHSQMIVSTSGHFHGPEEIENDIVYVVWTADGQKTLTLADFSSTYGWKNDRDRGKLLLGVADSAIGQRP